VGSHALTVGRHGLQAEDVVARGDHVQRNGVTIAAGVHVLGLKPRAQARVKDLRLALPEIRGQAALDPKVI